MKKVMKGMAVLVLAVFIAGGIVACAPEVTPVEPVEKEEPEKEPLIVGVISMMELDVGKSSLRGVEIAAEEINEAGGILGRPVEVVSADSKGLPDEGLRAFEYLVTRENADLVIGPFADAVLASIFPRLEEYKIPLIVNADSYYEIALKVHENYDTYKGWFRVMPINDFYLGYNIVEFGESMMVEELGWDSVVIFREQAAWTEGIVSLVEEEFPKIGLNIADHIVFPVDEKDYSPYYREAERSGADCIFAIVAEAGIAPILQYADFKPDMPLLGIVVSAQVPEFYDDTGGATGSVATMNIVGWNSEMDAKSRAFIDKWSEKYTTRPAKPDYAGFGGYIALNVFREAAERAGTFDLDPLVIELEKTDYHMTYRFQFYGRDEKDPYFGMYFTHDVKYGPDFAYAQWTQWQGDDAYTIWPEKFAVRDFVYPEWMK